MKCPEPSIAFAMDFTEKVIAGGDRVHILNIHLFFVNPGSPWENGFVERDMRTLKDECLNLIWINDITEIQPITENNLLSWWGAI